MRKDGQLEKKEGKEGVKVHTIDRGVCEDRGGRRKNLFALSSLDYLGFLSFLKWGKLSVLESRRLDLWPMGSALVPLISTRK